MSTDDTDARAWREMPTGKIVLTIEMVMPSLLLDDLQAWCAAHQEQMVSYELVATPAPLSRYLQESEEDERDG